MKLRGRISNEVTYPMIRTRSFRKRRTIARTMIGFAVMAAILCLFLGSVDILYVFGFGILILLIYLLTTAFAALLDPDVY